MELTDCSLLCRGANLIQIRLRDVLQGAQLLVAIEGHFVVARGQHGRFQAGLRGGDLRIQLVVGKACLLKRDLRRFHFIAKRRVVELKQQIAFFTWLLLWTCTAAT